MNREQIEQEQQQLAAEYQRLQQRLREVQTRIVENRGILRYLDEQGAEEEEPNPSGV